MNESANEIERVKVMRGIVLFWSVVLVLAFACLAFAGGRKTIRQLAQESKAEAQRIEAVAIQIQGGNDALDPRLNEIIIRARRIAENQKTIIEQGK